MLLDKISQEEFEMMDQWRRWYAWSENVYTHKNEYASMEDILRVWDDCKSEHLAKLFDGNLTISKRLHYTKCREEMENDITDMVAYNSRLGRAERNGYRFHTSWNSFLFKNYETFTAEQYDNLRRLMSDECLINNIYDGPSFKIDKPDGKQFAIHRGCKVSKTLGKLADIFELSGWEDFRICLSQILNQKELEGTLTISIHPLDYMTMSDNSYDWDSCMSWSREGGYRQGTVEMMNSKSVVIAYLSGDETMPIGNHQWNSKKWRQLFVVDHDIIASVKDYPYHNEELGKEIVKWLKELAEERLGWQYNDIIPYSFEDDTRFIHLDYLPEEKNNFSLCIEHSSMYNDFGCLDYHWMCFSKDINPNDIRGKNNPDTPWHNAYLPVYYSGPSQCMICGDRCPDFDDESCLACRDCQNRLRCDCCGEYVNDVFAIDDIQLCESCWDNRVVECANCRGQHYDDYMKSIFILPRLTPEQQEELKRNYYSQQYVSYRPKLVEDSEIVYMNHNAPNGYVCDNNKCFEAMIEKYLKPGERPHLRRVEYCDEVCIYLDQLNEEGVDMFAWGFKDNNEGYINTFQFYNRLSSRFIKLL